MNFKALAQESIDSYLKVWRKYTGFSGRTTRREFWQFIIINTLVVALIGLVEKIIGMDDGFFSSLYAIALICPDIALNTRRLHDVNKSGWWQLALAVPLLNLYVIYLAWFKAGDAGENKFGAPVAAAGDYSIPVNNEFADHEMCPAPKAEAEPVVIDPVAAESELPQLRKKCTSCGAEIKVAAKFCSECGAPADK